MIEFFEHCCKCISAWRSQVRKMDNGSVSFEGVVFFQCLQKVFRMLSAIIPDPKVVDTRVKKIG